MRAQRVFGVIAVLLIGAVLLVACGSSSNDNEPKNEPTNTPVEQELREAAGGDTAQGEYRTLTIDEFAEIVENRAGEYQIVNVHIPYAGEVANTDANIPFNDLDALMAAIPDKDTPVILYCRSGNMSQQASSALVEQGYTQVWDVPGGMVAWQSSGRTLIDK